MQLSILTAGSAFPSRCQTLKHTTDQTLQNALPAVDCQQRGLQVDTSVVAADSGSRLNENDSAPADEPLVHRVP